jgi:hypothetical protein
MVSSSQIKEQLAQFLARRISLDTFEDWLVQNTWDIHRSGSIAAESLAFAVEESLSEYSSQHLSERELRSELSTLIYQENRYAFVSNLPVARWHGAMADPAVLVCAQP